jgi:hypothetical protein
MRGATRALEVVMRTLASSSLVSLALLALASATLPAQRPADTVTLGRWVGRAELTVPWTVRRTLELRLDIHPDGGVSGTIGDALLVGAHIYRDSPVAHSLGLARDFAIEGGLSGALIRSEGVLRERVRLSVDCAVDRMTGDLVTSGVYDGPVSGRVLSARVRLERIGAVVAMRGGAARLTPAHVDARPLSP